MNNKFFFIRTKDAFVSASDTGKLVLSSNAQPTEREVFQFIAVGSKYALKTGVNTFVTVASSASSPPLHSSTTSTNAQAKFSVLGASSASFLACNGCYLTPGTSGPELTTHSTIANSNIFSLVDIEAMVLKLRQEITTYTFPKFIPEEERKELKQEDINKVRLVLFGQTGAGKSSFINTVSRALYGTAVLSQAPTFPQGVEGTRVLEEHLTEFPFTILDTRGFHYYDSQETSELLNILNGDLMSGDYVNREGNATTITQEAKIPKKNSIGNMIHSILFVMKANDPRLNNGVYEDNYSMIQSYMSKRGITPITVLTHEDLVTSTNGKEAAIRKARQVTGSFPLHVCTITNYTQNQLQNVLIDYKVLLILKDAITCGERTIKFMKISKTYNK